MNDLKKLIMLDPANLVKFDPTSEEMLQIIYRGRYRPKNYANFVLPKDKYVCFDFFMDTSRFFCENSDIRFNRKFK
jgi:hypothetical protein